MKSRPTIALACIMKNEAANLGPLINSVSGCFDEIYLTDTGSTDNTVEIATSDRLAEVAQCPVNVNNFEWVYDFAKARQFSFDQVPDEIDYIMWLDLDDSLNNKEAFIHFRDHSMHCSSMWLNDYRYAFNQKGQAVCTFLRERIVKNNGSFKWRYFLHEGLVQKEPHKPLKTMPIHTWTVDHRRTALDLQNDKGRNIAIFDKNKDHEDFKTPRMRYYYGKELYDAGRHLEAADVLHETLSEVGKNLQDHDRIMTIQYLSMAYGACERWEEALQIALQGIHLEPERSELWILGGDANYKLGRKSAAVNFYEMAKRGASSAMGGLTFTDPQSRNLYPFVQIATIAQEFHNGPLLKAQAEHLKTLEHPNADHLLSLADSFNVLNDIPEPDKLIQTEDVVITTPPMGATKNWDENSLEREGTGGSETAAIEIARWIKIKTGRPVKIFQIRDTSEKMPSGVEYYPGAKAQQYFANYLPKAHIAWRHAVRLTKAPSYVWSHDLVTHSGERLDQYDKYLCLSGFHKEFVKDMQKVPDEKIIVTKNGINPKDFEHLKDVEKVPGKVIFSSSPDRGMERCIEICKRAREEVPDLELHLFYGFKNMRLAGDDAQADYLEGLINKHDWVKYHGMVDKKTLMRHFAESEVWLYPADFIETFCITALEALATKAYPLVRNIGALRYTLAEALEKDMCTMLEPDADGPAMYDLWANELVACLKEKKWQKVDINIDDYSWERAAEHFIEFMDL